MLAALASGRNVGRPQGGIMVFNCDEAQVRRDGRQVKNRRKDLDAQGMLDEHD
jgi:hypothetical protein